MSNADIAGFADRINHLLNVKEEITSDVREVYDEAKEQGVNVTALRKVIAKRRAKTPDPTVVAAMEAYEHALDEASLMVSKGASLRQAEKATGASKSAIQRRQVSRRNENAISGTPHDPETGELTPPMFVGGNSAHEGEENGERVRIGEFGAGNTRSNVRASEGRPDADRDGEPIADLGQQQASAGRADRQHGGAAGAVRSAAEINQQRQGANGHRAGAGDAGQPALAGELDGRPDQPAGIDLLPAGRIDLTNANAAPDACVDGLSVSAPPAEAVPRCSTPQADEVGPLSVKPVPDEGVGAGPIPAGGAGNAGGDHDAGLTPPLEEEVARVAPPPSMILLAQDEIAQTDEAGAVGSLQGERVASRVMRDTMREIEAKVIATASVASIQEREGEGCGPDATPAGSDFRQSPQTRSPPLSHSTGDDGLELPRRLDRRVQV